MSSPFVGEVRPWGCNFAPYGWTQCNGQILPIQQYTALFSLLGTYYGGNGTSNFALPDLRSRVPMKYGTSPVGTYAIGEQGGAEIVTLLSSEMPIHNHTFLGTSDAATRSKPIAGAALATTLAPGGASPGDNYYSGSSNPVAINIGSLSPYAGSNQPHANIQPYLAVNWCIALTGIYPARN